MSIQFSRGRKEAMFKTDKFPSEAFCLVSQNLLSCFPGNLCHRFTPQGEAVWKRRLEKREKLGKTVCAGQSVCKSALSPVLEDRLGDVVRWC